MWDLTFKLGPNSFLLKCKLIVLWKEIHHLSQRIPSPHDNSHVQEVWLHCTQREHRFRTWGSVRIKENLLVFCRRSSINSHVFCRDNFRKYPAPKPKVTRTSTNGTSAARWGLPGSSSSMDSLPGSTVEGILGNTVAFLRFGSIKKHSWHFDQIRGVPVFRG